MAFTLSNRPFHEYRPITPQRATKLDEMLTFINQKLPTSIYGIGGGNAIPLLLRIYREVIAKKSNQTKAKEEIWQWLPKDATKTLIEGCYRDSNFIPHIICTEDNLEFLVGEANKSGFRLMQRTTDIGIPTTGKKIEFYQPTTPEEVRERSTAGSKEKYKSNSLRLVDQKAKQLIYFDLFIHHYIDEKGNKVVRYKDLVLKNISGKEIKASEVRVVSNKDQTGIADQSIAVPFESFLTIPYKFKGTTFNVANPKYLLRVKLNHARKNAKKGKNDTRDPIDIEILTSILKFLETEDPLRPNNEG